MAEKSSKPVYKITQFNVIVDEVENDSGGYLEVGFGVELQHPTGKKSRFTSIRIIDKEMIDPKNIGKVISDMGSQITKDITKNMYQARKREEIRRAKKAKKKAA